MQITSFIFFFIFLILLFTGFRKNADLFAPGRVFGMLWSLLLALVEFKYSRLQFEWSYADWFMVLLPLVTFSIGIYISYIINLNRPVTQIVNVRKTLRTNYINESNLFRFIIIYFLLCFASFLIEWKIEGYLPLFTARPDTARVIFGVFGLHYILNSINVVLFLVVEYYILIKGNFSRKILLLFIFILSLGNYILFVQRYGFFVFFMLAISFYFYTSKKISIKNLLIFVSVLIFLIIGIQSIRMPEIAKTIIIKDAQIKFSSDYAEFVIPYMYLVMNVENFAKYYSQVPNHSYGFFTFEFMNEILLIRPTIAEYFNFYKLKHYINGYNTYPFYWPYFYDFGIIGLATIPFILGFIFSELNYLLRRRADLLILSLNCVAFTVIMISYNSDSLTRLDTIITYIVIVLAQYFIIKKPKEKVYSRIK